MGKERPILPNVAFTAKTVIERNRLLLAFKLFPWSLLWLNPVYFGARLLAGVAASRRGADGVRCEDKWRLGRHAGGIWPEACLLLGACEPGE